MTYYFDLGPALWALGGLILGLLIGRAIWRRAAVTRVADSSASTAALAAAQGDADRRGRELAAAQAALRPLADEVDRLKRELAKAQRPIPLPLAAAALPAESSSAAVAGTGPIVVGDAGIATGHPAIPGIRQLKGVGDKFGTALEAIGLTSVDAIARLNGDEALDADTRLGVFNGRIAKDRLVEQATLLDEGRTTEYETRFGRIGGPVLI